MTLKGGKRKVNKSLKSWVAFVKRVQKEEKLNYKDAIHRAKVRKDKGEKWMMKGGDDYDDSDDPDAKEANNNKNYDEDAKNANDESDMSSNGDGDGTIKTGGRHRTRSRRGGKSMKRKSGKTKRRRSRRH